MPLDASHYNNEREELSQALFDCRGKKKEQWDDLVCSLPDYIQGNIERRSALQDDIRNIVAACCRYEDGLPQLFDLLKKREGPSNPYKHAFALWQRWHWRVAVIDLMEQSQ
ncbi:MAG: hypothetical protein KC496_13380, partial [Anaerolineae bacterium]|nr:hypothetical protein [Anaerolineae bacterium]